MDVGLQRAVLGHFPIAQVSPDPGSAGSELSLLAHRYRFLAPGDTQVWMTVGAQKGRVFVMAAQAAKGRMTEETEKQLKLSADSFRLKGRFVPLF